MRRKVSLFVLGALAVGVVSAAGVLAPGGGASPKAASKTVNITVSATEFKFVLSKRSVPVGSTVVFTVINKGKIAHDFRILGTSISARTGLLKPGQRATLRATLIKKGKYKYLCTVPGHAKLGMKGVFAGADAKR